jgi:hypothetical protein
MIRRLQFVILKTPGYRATFLLSQNNTSQENKKSSLNTKEKKDRNRSNSEGGRLKKQNSKK